MAPGCGCYWPRDTTDMTGSLTVATTLDALKEISAFITDAATHAGLDEHTTWQVELAVDEAATNIIQHAMAGTPGTMELTWRVESGAFVVMLRDWGRPFDPAQVPTPDIHSPLEERQAGGLGIFLMNRLMDSVDFSFDPDQGNLLVMRKALVRGDGPQVFTLGGRLDASSVDRALQSARAAMGDGARQIVLDMSDVSFLSSSGLRALLILRKELLTFDGALRLCCLQPHVYEVFAITGFTQVFAIHEDRAAALAAFGEEHA